MASVSSSLLSHSDLDSLQAVATAGKVGLWEWDLVSNEVKWNTAVYAAHGVDPATFPLTLANHLALIHPDDVQRVRDAVKKAIEHDAPYELEFRIRRPDGRVSWVFNNGTVVRQDGKAIRMIGSTIDVTALRHSGDDSLRLAAIVESSDDAILSKDLNGTIITWNAAAERLFGYTAKEVVGNSVTMLIPADRLDEEPGILERIRRGERIEHYETVRQRKDGSLFHVSLSVSPIVDSSGKVVGASKIARDITDRRRAEDALRSSEERFRLLASHAPVGIFLSDPQGKCVFVNEAWCDMAGLPAERALGDGWADAVHPDDRAQVLAGWREAVKAGAPSVSEFRFLQPNGKTVWLHGSAVQFRDGERFQGYMGSCVNVTQRKESELQAKFLNELSDQLAAITDPDAIMDAAQSSLGRHLGVDRCYFFEMNSAANTATVQHEWHIGDQKPIEGTYRLEDFGSPEYLAFLAQPRAAIADVREHPITRGQCQNLEAVDIRAVAVSTFTLEGRRLLSLGVTCRAPHDWTPAELDLLENVTARIWPAVERARADKALRASEQLYRAIGDSLDYGVWVTDATGRALYNSESFLKLVGIPEAAGLNEGWVKVLHPDEIAATATAWQECVRTGEIFEREHRVKGVDGNWHPILSRGVPIRNPTGQVERWVGINLDIAGRRQAQESARQRMSALEKLNVVGVKLVAEHDQEKIVQLVTDVGTEVSGAAFGAFFYNVANEKGESYMLYTLSGVPREAFSQFPMPRATEMFGPTFRGEGVIRVADVRTDPRYGKNAPHQGMPAGHLPVRSYLAVPVTSRTGEVLGGLFFGHPSVGVFTAESETVLVALAAQAAIALDNAKLYAALQRELAEQRRSETLLRESETRWRQLAEAMPHLVWSCRPDGYCDYLSPQWVAYTGVAELDQLGDGWVEYVHPDDRDSLSRKWTNSTAHGEIFDTEFRIRRADGKYRWFKTRAVPVRDPDGNITKWYGTNTDIEEFRRIENAIRESEHQLRLVTDHAPVFIVQVDTGHRIKFANRPYAERYGKIREQLIGLHVSELTGSAAYETFRHHMDHTLAGQRVEFEQEVPYSTLGRRWVHVIYEPERDAERRITGLVAVVVDVTKRKQEEFELAKARDDALAASRAKDDFLAALSHELRTPLSPVLLVASDAANNPALPRDIRESFELIRTNVSLEARLIDDLLDLTRITRGKMPLEKHLLDIHDVLRDAVSNIRPDIDAKHMEFSLQVKAERSTVMGDPVRLQQVFWNILKNAVKFTPERGRITIVTEFASDPDRITIEVSDSGLGMSPGELGRVFEAFTQGDHAAGSGSHRYGGLGLGLAISQKLVELHAGRIYASSEGRNRGSIFVIELPVTIPPRASGLLAADTSLVAPDKPALVTGSILLVEDHPSTRETLQKLLVRRNYEVVTASCTADARATAATRSFDYLISDVGLPDGDGYQLMKAIREIQPSIQGIAISGYGMEEDLQRSHLSGFSIHLVKPVGITALEKALASLAKPKS